MQNIERIQRLKAHAGDVSDALAELGAQTDDADTVSVAVIKVGLVLLKTIEVIEEVLSDLQAEGWT